MLKSTHLIALTRMSHDQREALNLVENQANEHIKSVEHSFRMVENGYNLKINELRTEIEKWKTLAQTDRTR